MQRSRRDRISQTLIAHRGILRVDTVLEAGVSRYDIAQAIEAGEIIRPMRGWLATPDADRMLVNAARTGVVLTCVTQARRLGLWVHDEKPGIHVGATPGSRGGKSRLLRVHWARPLVPRHPDALEDPVENVLAIVAECEPYEQALATWDSALNKGIVERDVLAALPLRPRARRLLEDAWPFSDAGLETYLRPRLRWLRIPLYFQTWIAGHRADALIGERLVFQVDGATHTGPQRSEDIRHDAQLKLMGYHVVRVSYEQVMREWHVVQDLIMRAVAQGLHLARPA